MHEESYFCVVYVCKKYVCMLLHRRDRIVVSTLRCGRNNPGSNPGHGTLLYLIHLTNDGTGRIQNIAVGFDGSGIQQVNQSTC